MMLEAGPASRGTGRFIHNLLDRGLRHPRPSPASGGRSADRCRPLWRRRRSRPRRSAPDKPRHGAGGAGPAAEKLRRPRAVGRVRTALRFRRDGATTSRCWGRGTTATSCSTWRICATPSRPAPSPIPRAQTPSSTSARKRFGSLRQSFQAVLDRAGFGKRVIALPEAPAIWALRALEAAHLSPLYKWIYETAGTDSYVGIDRAREVLGYAPRYSNEEALIRNFEWYLEKPRAHLDRDRRDPPRPLEARGACRRAVVHLIRPPRLSASGPRAPCRTAPSRSLSNR